MRHSTKIRIRFGDTDMFGHVNNAKYFTYMEEARTEFLREILFADRFPLILASAKVDFLAQTFFGQTLEVESFISRIGNSSFDVMNVMKVVGMEQPVFRGAAVLVYFNYDAQRPEPIPDEFRDKLVQYIEKE